MKRFALPFLIVFFLFPVQIKAQNQSHSSDKKVDYPEVPRVSAYEAYVKYKGGKAIILQAGGEHYGKRHIMGAFNMGPEAGIKRTKLLPNFPKKGMEIFTYCY